MMGNYVSGHSRSCRLITKPTVQRKTSLEMLTDPIKKKHLKRNQVLPHSETVPQTGVCCASGTLTLTFNFNSALEHRKVIRICRMAARAGTLT
ncbi:hypothetical protein COCSUDRAFT_33458 [Coccomyxa subellipsoidea C-169]|uniref:Uncharacterized protein n=1 Tax=Coccomyxa subellipsoidea (strain C-169) TaxID=574566 RepID=I0YV06_COCSC|nr:hypothetical protein COCSUDRAFT_33458 [Coccomyxa subellipsoidea C-169]EIE22225.1 hypothetical protein COCSUDRAFT_33458 [Coccomyxa subellipsoidea C-169]|eukprot:XP_005646769.1 hypothetical protein COCSUDRAFT_33458 [Coccomyxa subellipsoidea C-169]